jgi:outer membrane protein assembly factor BamD
VICIGILTVILAGCGGNALKNAPTAQQQFEYAKKKYDKEKYYDAVEGFQKVIFNFPGTTIVDTALYYLALSYYGNKEYELAAVEFQRLTTSYPLSDFVDEAQYMAAVCYLKNSPGHYGLDQEDLKTGVRMMEEFVIDNPDSPILTDARNQISQGYTKLARKEYENGILYLKMYDLTASSIYFQHVVDNYTNTEYAALALYRLSEIEYKRGNYVEAMDKFKSFISIYPGNEMIPEAQEYIDEISKRLVSSDATDDS